MLSFAITVAVLKLHSCVPLGRGKIPFFLTQYAVKYGAMSGPKSGKHLLELEQLFLQKPHTRQDLLGQLSSSPHLQQLLLG